MCPYYGLVEDRDVHAAKNMVVFYLRYKDAVVTTVSKPVAIKFSNKFLAKQEDTNLIV